MVALRSARLCSGYLSSRCSRLFVTGGQPSAQETWWRLYRPIGYGVSTLEMPRWKFSLPRCHRSCPARWSPQTTQRPPPTSAAASPKGRRRGLRQTLPFSPPPPPGKSDEKGEEKAMTKSAVPVGPKRSRSALPPPLTAGLSSLEMVHIRTGIETKTIAVAKRSAGPRRRARRSQAAERRVSTMPNRRARLGLPLIRSGARSYRSSTAWTASITAAPQSMACHGRKRRPSHKGEEGLLVTVEPRRQLPLQVAGHADGVGAEKERAGRQPGR